MNGRLFTPAAVLGMLFGGLVVGLWFARSADSTPEPVLSSPSAATIQRSAPTVNSTPPETSSPSATVSEPDEVPTSDADLRRPDPEGEALTASAVKEQDMSEMEGGVAEYDARVEARQRFRDFELTAIAARPLTPEKWRAIQADRGEEVLEVLKRAKQLTDEGEPEAARELMEEWQRLTSLYKNEAYGRGLMLGTE